MAVHYMESLAGVSDFELVITDGRLEEFNTAVDGKLVALPSGSAGSRLVGVRQGLTGKEAYVLNTNTGTNTSYTLAVYNPLGDLSSLSKVSISCRLAGDFVSTSESLMSGSGFATVRQAGAIRVINPSLSAPIYGPSFMRSETGFVRAMSYVSGGPSGDTIPAVPDSTVNWSAEEPNTLEMALDFSLSQAEVLVNGISIGVLPFNIDGDSGSVNPANLAIGFSVYQRIVNGINAGWGDVVVTDTSPGEYRIQVLKPSADVDSEFTPDTGTESFSRINESPPDGDASYIAATTPGSKALFNYGDPNGNPLELGPNQGVLAVKHTVQARNEVPDARQLKAVYRKNGVDTPTEAGVQVTGEYQLASEFIETNPATGTAWQPGDFTDWAFGFMIEEDE